jgi:uncharacterized membrane protein YfhO
MPFNNSFILVNDNVKKSFDNFKRNRLNEFFEEYKKDINYLGFFINEQYIISKDDLDDNYEFITNINDESKLYRYKYEVKNAFKYDKNNKINELNESSKLYDRINLISKNYFNIDNILNKIDNYSIVEDTDSLEFAKVKFDIKVEGKKEFYYDLDEVIAVDISIIQNDVIKNIEINRGLIDLGFFENENIRIELTVLKKDIGNNLSIYAFDLDKYYELINNCEVIECNKNNNIVEYKLNGTTNDSLLIPLSYDKNWNITINGQKVNYDRALDGFISVDLVDGENNIRLEFFNYDIIIGSIITIIGIVALVIVNKFSIIFENKVLQTIAYYAFNIIAVGLLLFINIGGIIYTFL